MNEGNYNDADVEEILDHAKEMVTSSLESELSFIGHTQALLVRQLMTQAEIHEVLSMPGAVVTLTHSMVG